MDKDLFGNPIVEPEPPPADDAFYADLVVMVRGGQRFEDLELSPETIARMRADGTLDENMKPIHPISEWRGWSEDLDAYELACERFFAR